ncbi:MAG: TIGR03560 family F420-dependent LLM class oxidoreductase [Candidatus Hodarchaeota archaeon]
MIIPTIGIHIIQSHMNFSQIREVSNAAERLGFNSVTVMDHFRTTIPPLEGNLLECWTTLSALARETRNIKLGSMVTCASFRNPALLAKLAASLDCISNGRLKFGIGAGWCQGEFEEYGYSFSTPKERIERLNESVQIIKALWTHERTSFKGKHFKIQEAVCYPKPIQIPFPPIFIGGGGEQLTLRVVAEQADGWNWGGSIDEYSHKIKVLKQHCKKVNRKFEEICLSWLGWVVPSSDPKEISKFLPEIQLETHEMINRHLFGTAEQCITKLRNLIDLGVTDFELVFPDTIPVRQGTPTPISLDSMKWFAERVIPEIELPK